MPQLEPEARLASLFPGEVEVLSKAEFVRVFGHHGSEENQRLAADQLARRTGCAIQFFNGNSVYASFTGGKNTEAGSSAS